VTGVALGIVLAAAVVAPIAHAEDARSPNSVDPCTLVDGAVVADILKDGPAHAAAEDARRIPPNVLKRLGSSYWTWTSEKVSNDADGSAYRAKEACEYEFREHSPMPDMDNNWSVRDMGPVTFRFHLVTADMFRLHTLGEKATRIDGLGDDAVSVSGTMYVLVKDLAVTIDPDLPEQTARRVLRTIVPRLRTAQRDRPAVAK
jgi:hypothetical protein